MVGETISHYKVLEKIGQGGMGEVFLAQDTSLDRKVALKFLTEDLQQDPTARKRFLREAKSAAALDHPFICKIYQVGEAQEQPFIAMEYLQGITLQEKLAGGPLPVREAVETASEVAEALEAAHKQSIVHRDLKPSNIMLTLERHVKVMDFGLAKRVGPIDEPEQEITTALTREGMAIGTVPYMSPEQVRGQAIDTRSDIFSFGVVLFQMLTGVHPFRKATSLDTASAILRDDPPLLSKYVTELPEALQHVVNKTLAKNAQERCQSAREVLVDLKLLAGAVPLSAGTDELPTPDTRGEPGFAALAAEGEASRGFSPAVAWMCLVGTVVALAATLWIAGQSGLSQIVPLPKSPELLIADARAILEDLGYSTPQRDSTHGFIRDTRYIDHLMSQERSRTWWELLARGEPNVIRFWYRESPRYLVPHRTTEFFPAEHDPPLSVPGMVSLQLDTFGRLRRLEAVPVNLEGASEESMAADWGSLFATAQLDLEDFTPDRPESSPSSPAYRQAAWQGTYPDAPEIPIRIEAAFFGGRPVAFEILEPWDEAGGQGGGFVQSADVVLDAWASFAHVALQLILILTLVLLAQRNFRANRGDRKLAFRLACYFFALVMLYWVLAANHVPEGSQVEILFGALYRAFSAFGIAWLFYIGLEPYARRLWPQTLISWVCLLEGRFREPRVGRDVLAGCTYGIGCALMFQIFGMAAGWLGGVPPRPDLPVHPAELIALSGVKESIGELLSIQVNISTLILYLVGALVLLKLICRRTWLAVVVHAVLYVFVYASGFGLVGIVLSISFWYLVFFRFGWVSVLVGTFIQDLLHGYPLTTDLSAWYAHASILAVVVCLALTVYGFKVSLAGRPAFKDLLVEG